YASVGCCGSSLSSRRVRSFARSSAISNVLQTHPPLHLPVLAKREACSPKLTPPRGVPARTRALGHSHPLCPLPSSSSQPTPSPSPASPSRSEALAPETPCDCPPPHPAWYAKAAFCRDMQRCAPPGGQGENAFCTSYPPGRTIYPALKDQAYRGQFLV